MPVNFFEAHCQEETNEDRFGLCDDPPPPGNIPAYIDTLNSTKWIAIISNINKETIVFTAIDSCIQIFRADGSQESRCDGMLTYLSNIIFIELKERQSSGWLNKAEDQLKITIAIFAASYDLTKFDDNSAYVANSFRPNMQFSESVRKQKFKDDTGFILKIQTDITI